MDDIYKNIEKTIYIKNANNWLYLIVLLMICLFIRGAKSDVSLVFITQSYFVVTWNVGLNSAHYFIMKVPNKWGLQKL